MLADQRPILRRQLVCNTSPWEQQLRQARDWRDVEALVDRLGGQDALTPQVLYSYDFLAVLNKPTGVQTFSVTVLMLQLHP
jgi:hypothetical protein